MPKKKVDSQQGVRLELQESERDMLRFYTTSAAIKNVGIGVGAVALPACIVAAGIFVAAIFNKGYDELAGDLRNAITERQNRSEAEWAEAYEIYVQEHNERKQRIKGGDIGGPVGLNTLWDIFGPSDAEIEAAEPISYDEWRVKTDPERSISLFNNVAGGMGSLATFGLSER